MVETGAGGFHQPDWDALANDLIPEVHNTYNLGSDTKSWAVIYAVIAVLTSITLGGIYLGATTDGYFFVNASTQINGSLDVKGNITASGNISADYFYGDGSNLTGLLTGDNESWNQTFANTLYADISVTDDVTTLTNNSMVDTLHRHSELSASDGTPDASLVLDTAGRMTNANQPSFQAVPTADQLNIAVDTAVTDVLGTERFDVGGNFASNTFTAPITGKYYLGGNVNLQSVDSASTYYGVRLVTSNKVYYYNLPSASLAADANQWSLPFSVVADMDVNDTAYLVVYQASGTNQTDITAQDTFFSGALIS